MSVAELLERAANIGDVDSARSLMNLVMQFRKVRYMIFLFGDYPNPSAVGLQPPGTVRACRRRRTVFFRRIRTVRAAEPGRRLREPAVLDAQPHRVFSARAILPRWRSVGRASGRLAGPDRGGMLGQVDEYLVNRPDSPVIIR